VLGRMGDLGHRCESDRHGGQTHGLFVQLSTFRCTVEINELLCENGDGFSGGTRSRLGVSWTILI